MKRYVFNKDCELINNYNDNKYTFIIMNFETLKMLKINETSYHILDFLRRKKTPVKVKEINEFVFERFKGFDASKIDEEVIKHLTELQNYNFIQEFK